MIATRFYDRISKYAIAMVLPWLLCSCFTGIESTKTITPGREDRRQIAPTEEELLLSHIASPRLKYWEEGKYFIVVDQRLGYVLESSTLHPSELSLKDSLLIYKGVNKRVMPDGKSQAVLKFELPKFPGQSLLLPTGREYESAIESYTTLQLPMMLDPMLTEQARAILFNRDLYTLSSLWYDAQGNRITGLKYTPVHIDDVVAGNAQFPLYVKFNTSTGEEAGVYMNLGNSGYDSRQFANLFSLSDIRKKYPSISDKVWDNICHGRVALGMTKEECRLALGAPSGVNAGHTYSETLDIWQYQDGKYLRFTDGVLTDFRN